MKIVRYVDVFPGQKPDDVHFKTREQAVRSPKGPLAKRYRVEFVVPDPHPVDVDGVAKQIEIEEIEDE